LHRPLAVPHTCEFTSVPEPPFRRAKKTMKSLISFFVLGLLAPTDAATYVSSKKGRECETQVPAVGFAISSAESCKLAAEEYNLKFVKEVYSSSRPGGCFFKGKRAWFNTKLSSGKGGPYRKYFQLCEPLVEAPGTTDAPTKTPKGYDVFIRQTKGRGCKLGYSFSSGKSSAVGGDEEVECKEFAEDHGLPYHSECWNEWHINNDPSLAKECSHYSNDHPQGCLKMGNQVYWNTITGQRSQKKVDGKAQAICISDDGDYQATFKWGMAGMGPMKDGAVVPTNRPHEVANYFRRKPLWGLNCPNSRMIQSEMNCKNACVEMGLGYKKKIDNNSRPGGCMAEKSRCYFNEALVPNSNLPKDSGSGVTKFKKQQGVCKAPV